MSYFFLSYARGDDDVFVGRFFEDLSKEVRVLAGLAAGGAVGFFDQRSIESGEDWSARVVMEIGRCGSFVALYSPRFFLSEACGTEWAIFRDRVEAFGQQLGEPASALIPLLWAPVPELPEVVRSIQYTSPGMGNAYRDGGLRQLLRLYRNRDAYRNALFRIATRIVAANRSAMLPPRTPAHSLDTVSAFHTGGNGAHQALAGPQAVRFVVVSSSRTSAQQVRRDLSCYGDRPQDWAPYRPGTTGSLSELARRMAAQHGYLTSVDTVDDLQGCLSDASRYNQIVVLLVDPWSLLLESAQRQLLEFDLLTEPAVAVLIPFSLEDDETRRRRDELHGAIRQVFPSSTQRLDDLMFRASVPTAESFRMELPMVLEYARNRLFTRGIVYRRPPTSPGRPILDGPLGEER